MEGVQCYELFGGIALKIHTFSFHFIGKIFFAVYFEGNVLLCLLFHGLFCFFLSVYVYTLYIHILNRCIYMYTHIYIVTFFILFYVVCLINVVKLCNPLSILDHPTLRKGS